MGSEPTPRRRSRGRLYAPFFLLGLLAFGWSGAWAFFRQATVAGLDGWIADEAAAGRRWSCPDRTVGGYPFRIEVVCASVALEAADLAVSLGRLRALAQVYRPRHVIADAQGPLRVKAGDHAGEASWTSLRASVVTNPAGLERLSLLAEAPTARHEPPGAPAISLSSRRLDAHLRPTGAERDRWEAALRSEASAVPILDWLLGGPEPSDVDFALTVSHVPEQPARTLPAELERWRQAGGQAEITQLALAKGPRRLQARGTFGLDAERRLAGEAEVSARQLGGVLGRFAGDRTIRLAERLGAVLGAAAPPRPAATPGEPALTPLPPLRLSGGRLHLGRIPIPYLDFPPLY